MLPQPQAEWRAVLRIECLLSALLLEAGIACGSVVKQKNSSILGPTLQSQDNELEAAIDACKAPGPSLASVWTCV